MTLKVGMQRLVLEWYQFYLNDDPGMTLTQFTATSNLVPYAFVWEKGKTIIFFRNYWVYDIKVGRCVQLNEALWLWKIKVIHGPWSFIDLGPNHSDSVFLNFFSSTTTWPKSSSLEPKGRWPWNLVCSIAYSGATKFVQMMPQGFSNDAPGLILTYFMARLNLVLYALLYRKNLKQWLFQKLL